MPRPRRSVTGELEFALQGLRFRVAENIGVAFAFGRRSGLPLR